MRRAAGQSLQGQSPPGTRNCTAAFSRVCSEIVASSELFSIFLASLWRYATVFLWIVNVVKKLNFNNKHFYLHKMYRSIYQSLSQVVHEVFGN
jgi:hypothetical protein